MNKAFFLGLYLTCFLGIAQAQTFRFTSQDIVKGCRSGVVVGDDKLNRDEIRVVFIGARQAIAGRISLAQGSVQGRRIVGVSNVADVTLDGQGRVTGVEPLEPLFSQTERDEFKQRTARYKEAVARCANTRPGGQNGF